MEENGLLWQDPADTLTTEFIPQWEEPISEEVVCPDVDAILHQLNATAVSERMQAAREFAEIVEPRAIPRLIALLADPCPLVRISAAYGLGRNPDPAAVEPLIQCLSDFNDYVRKGAVWALGNCKDERALYPLLQSLRFDISAIRLWSASALGQLGNLGAIDWLILALHRDPDAAVRANSAWALGRLGDERVVSDLQLGLSDMDLGVQQDCQAALLHLGLA